LGSARALGRRRADGNDLDPILVRQAGRHLRKRQAKADDIHDFLCRKNIRHRLVFLKSADAMQLPSYIGFRNLRQSRGNCTILIFASIADQGVDC